MTDEKKTTTRRVSRRDFVKGAAAGATLLTGAGALAACGTTAAPGAAPGVPESWDRETDVVIVGYGGAGARAAIAASDAGAEVLILEKRSVAGGASAICGGVIYAGGTSVQEANEIEDSADNLYQHYLNAGKGFIDTELARMAADSARENIDFLIGLGAEFPNPPSVSGAEFKVGSEPIARVHRVAYGDLVGGAAFFRVLADGAEERGAEVLLETPGKSLVVDGDGQVVGVVAESDGSEIYIKARKAVVLTAGGFTRSKEMLAAYTKDGYYGQPLGPEGLDGDGHRMALALGADMMNMWKIVGIFGVTPPGAVSATYASTGGIVVNLEGKRFVDETSFYDVHSNELLEQDEGRGFSIFDEAYREAAGGPVIGAFSEDLEEEVSTGLVFKADTIGALAQQMGVPADRLEETVATWNEGVEAGEDGEFGRTARLAPIDTPPYYAFETYAAVFDTVGGAKINEKAQVVDVWGDVIPRLYAAGVNTGGLIGEYYPGSGTALNTTILTFGRVAGESAAAEEPWG